MKKALLALALVVSTTGASYSQTTAASSDIGYLSTSGCKTGQTVCFIQYGATIPVTGTITPSGTQDVNVVSVGGNTVTTTVPVSGTVTANQGTAGATPWPVLATGTGTFAVQNTAATPAGANVIGHVIADTGSTTAVTGNVTVVQPTASSLNATVIGTGTLAVQNTATASATVGVSTQSCTVACASTIVSGAHSLYGISGSATVTGTILVYDATSCSANGTVTPKKAFAYTVANAPFGVSWGELPMINATGVAVCFSSTGPFTATASTTAFLSVDYK